MPRKKSSRGPQGGGSKPRQLADGRWQARYTIGRDPKTGKQIQKPVYGKTEKEALEKLQEKLYGIRHGTYIASSNLTVGEWCDVYMKDFTGRIKGGTPETYDGYVKNHIKPKLGTVRLQDLTHIQVQEFVNGLTDAGQAPKSVKNIYAFFKMVLQRAMKSNIMSSNPAEDCILPEVGTPNIAVMSDDIVSDFLRRIKGHKYETVYFMYLFSGMREGEPLGLPWRNIDFDRGTILIDQQLLYTKKSPRRYYIGLPKEGKIRTIVPTAIVMEELRKQKARQAEMQLKAGAAWNNEWDLVFTNEVGRHLIHNTVYKNYKCIVEEMGFPELTVHGMRHTYVAMSLANGDDTKTIQDNVGHHSEVFTLEKYGHSTIDMKKASSTRMNDRILNLQQRDKEKAE